MLTTKSSAVQSNPQTVPVKQALKKNSLLAGCLANRFKVTVIGLQITTGVISAVAAIVAGIFASYLLLALAAAACLLSITNAILTSRIKTTQIETKKGVEKAKDPIEVPVQLKDPKQEQELQKKIEDITKNLENLKKVNEDLKKSELEKQAALDSQKDISEQQIADIIEKSEGKIVKLEEVIKKLEESNKKLQEEIKKLKHIEENDELKHLEENDELKNIKPAPVPVPQSSPARAALKRQKTLLEDATKLNEENEHLQSQLETLPTESPKTIRIKHLSLNASKIEEENRKLNEQLEALKNSSNESPSSETLQRVNELAKDVATLRQQNEELKRELAEKQADSNNPSAVPDLPPAPPAGGPPPPPPPLLGLNTPKKPYRVATDNKGPNSVNKLKAQAAGATVDMSLVSARAEASKKARAAAEPGKIAAHKESIEKKLSPIKESLTTELRKIKEFEGGLVDFIRLLKDLQLPKKIRDTDAKRQEKDDFVNFIQDIIQGK